MRVLISQMGEIVAKCHVCHLAQCILSKVNDILRKKHFWAYSYVFLYYFKKYILTLRSCRDHIWVIFSYFIVLGCPILCFGLDVAFGLVFSYFGLIWWVFALSWSRWHLGLKNGLICIDYPYGKQLFQTFGVHAKWSTIYLKSIQFYVLCWMFHVLVSSLLHVWRKWSKNRGVLLYLWYVKSCFWMCW